MSQSQNENYTQTPTAHSQYTQPNETKHSTTPRAQDNKKSTEKRKEKKGHSSRSKHESHRSHHGKSERRRAKESLKDSLASVDQTTPMQRWLEEPGEEEPYFGYDVAVAYESAPDSTYVRTGTGNGQHSNSIVVETQSEQRVDLMGYVPGW